MHPPGAAVPDGVGHELARERVDEMVTTAEGVVLDLDLRLEATAVRMVVTEGLQDGVQADAAGWTMCTVLRRSREASSSASSA